MAAIWKIPKAWRPSLADRTVLYPALYLRWAGHRTTISEDPPCGAWAKADLRVLVTDGPLGQDDRELIARTARDGLPLMLAPQAGLTEADHAFAAELGCRIVAWRDPGPLATPPPMRPGLPPLDVTGLPARSAEDRILLAALGLPASAAQPAAGRRIVAIAESAQSLAAISPAIEQRLAMGGAKLVTALGPSASDPGLLALIQGAECVLCIFPDAAADDPRPAQWVRTALFAGSPVIAASHPSLDGLAHLCILDDWERGLQLYARLPAERLRAAASTPWVPAREGLSPERIASLG